MTQFGNAKYYTKTLNIAMQMLYRKYQYTWHPLPKYKCELDKQGLNDLRNLEQSKSFFLF